MACRLNLLMKMFAISGKDLSDVLHVDSSLVSKWRSGKRPLPRRSVYVDKIVMHVMERDRPNHYLNVRKLLAGENGGTFSCTEKELFCKVKSWLVCENDANQKGFYWDRLKDSDYADMSVFYKFHGSEGRLKAVRFWLDYAISHSPEVEMLSFTNEESSPFYTDPVFLNEWTQKNDWLLRNGNTIKVIHTVDRTYDCMATSMLRWMPLHMTGRTQAFYIPKYTDEAIRMTVFLIPHQMVLFGISSKIYGKKVDTYLTNDEGFLESIRGVVQDYFDISIPIFNRYKLKENVNFINDFIGILEKKKDKYQFCSTFLFIPLPENLIVKILASNCVPIQEIPECVELYKIISALCMRTQNRYIINYQKMNEMFNRQSIMLDSFSFILGAPISVSKELFAQIVYESIGSIQDNSNIGIGMTDSDILCNLDNINIFAQENTCCNFSSADLETPILMATKELTVVTGVFRKLDQIWEQIPRINRNKVFVCNQLCGLLAVQEKAPDIMAEAAPRKG